MLRKNLLLLLLLVTINAHSQTLFEDASGESSIFLSDAPWFWARVNTGTESVSVGYNRVKSSGYDGVSKLFKSYRYFYGGDIKKKITDGLGDLFTANKINTGISFNANFGLQGVNISNTTPDIYTLYLRGGLSYDKYTLIDTLSATVNDLKKTQGFLELHFNKQWITNFTNGHQHYFLFGASFGVKGSNNLEDLDDITATTTLKTKDDVAFTTAKEGKLGVYSRQTSLPLRVDGGFIPTIFGENIIGFNTYGRANFNMPDNPVNLGAGVFFSKKGTPTDVIGGIAWQFNDVINDKALLKGSTIFFYVGYTIK